MDRTIISHNDDFPTTNNKLVMWNKHTIGNEQFVSFLQKVEQNQRQEQPTIQQPSTCNENEFKYVFARLQDLFEVWEYHNWPDYLQTLGFMKYEGGEFRLYSLWGSDNSKSVKLKFNTYSNNEPCANLYVKIYGFCAKENLAVDVELPYIEVRVNVWLNLGSLQQARHNEQLLYRLNNSNQNM